MERQFLLKRSGEIQEPCCFLNSPIEALKWAKMKEILGGARRRKKLDSMLVQT